MDMGEYDNHKNDYDDSGERTVSELEDVHSTLKEILSTLNPELISPDCFGASSLFYFYGIGRVLGRISGQIKRGTRSDTVPISTTSRLRRDPWIAISLTPLWGIKAASTRSAPTYSAMSSARHLSSKPHLKNRDRDTNNSRTQ
jgi:hypothetical protein